MTTGLTTATGVCFRKLDGHLPATVGHAAAHMFGKAARMGLMTEPTGPAASVLVDVDKMEVSVAIAEFGQSLRTSRQHQGIQVTRKAEIVVFLFKGRIEGRGVLLDQQAKVITAMGIMTDAAISLGNGAVMKVLALYLRGEGRQHRAFLHRDGFAMAVQAEYHGIGLQAERDRRGMCRVTLQASPRFGHGSMGMCGGLRGVPNIFMTGIAQVRRIRL